MARNTQSGFRKGSVKDRTQVFNPKTEQYVKRDSTTGKILASSDNKFKGIREIKSCK